MTIDSINQLGRPAAPAEAATQRGQLGRDDFMKLLVTQLRNQDPSNPMDPRDSIAQLAQLSSVEQLISIRDRLSALEVGTTGMANAQATSMIGRTVTANAASMDLGTVGSTQTSFSLAGRAEHVKATIRNAAGDAVRTVDLGALYPGTRSISWDGEDDAGHRLPAGRYTVDYRAVDGSGAPVDVSTLMVGRVESVDFSNGHPELDIGSARVLLGDVVGVSD